MNAWKQTCAHALPHLLTIEHGTVTSAARWAAEAMPEWRELTERAAADRPDPVKRWWSDSTPELVAQTRAFAEFVGASSS